MPGTPTDKYDLPTLDNEDFVNTYPAAHNAAMALLDGLIASAITGARPAAGIFGRFHRDAGTGVLSFDTGTAWVDLVATTDVSGLSFVGQVTLDAGNSDLVLPNQEWLRADGRLIDRTTYAAYFARVGHAHNGGVDPGSNMVRLPDYRGRALVGPDNMGTALGAGNRIPNSNRARGQNGGEERHTLTTGELAAHTHGNSLSDPGHGHVLAMRASGTGGGPTDYTHRHWGNNGRGAEAATSNVLGQTIIDYDANVSGSGTGISLSNGSVGSGSAHNNMQPYACDNVMVRVR